MQTKVVRRRLVAVLLFLSLCFVGDRGGALLLDSVVARSNIRFSKLYTAKLDAQLVVLGSSRAVNSVIPTIASETFGRKTFSLAHNGLSMQISEALLLDYLDRNDKPESVLIEVSNIFSDDSAIQNLRMYYRRSERLRDLAKESDSTGYKATSLTRLYAYNSDMFRRALFYLTRSDQAWSNAYRISPAIIERWRTAPSFDSERALVPQTESLRRVIRLLRDRGIRPVLFIGPYLPEYKSQWKNFAEWRSDILAGALDVCVWDYSSRLNDHMDFADHHHLSRKGARSILQVMADDRVLSTTADPHCVSDSGH